MFINHCTASTIEFIIWPSHKVLTSTNPPDICRVSANAVVPPTVDRTGRFTIMHSQTGENPSPTTWQFLKRHVTHINRISIISQGNRFQNVAYKQSINLHINICLKARTVYFYNIFKYCTLCLIIGTKL